MGDDVELDAEAVRARLPDGWRVENAGAGVYGYIDGEPSTNFVDLADMSVSFTIRRKGDLWAATWKEAHELDDRVRGVRERCVEWIAEKAHNAEGYSSE